MASLDGGRRKETPVTSSAPIRARCRAARPRALRGLWGIPSPLTAPMASCKSPTHPRLIPRTLTIEAWVRFDSLDSAGSGGSPVGEQYIVFKQNTRTSSFEGYCLGKIRLVGGDVFTFGVVSAAGQDSQLNSTVTVATNQWYHIAGVRGPDFLQLYINGQLNGQTNANFPQDDGTNPPLLPGQRANPIGITSLKVRWMKCRCIVAHWAPTKSAVSTPRDTRESARRRPLSQLSFRREPCNLCKSFPS